MRCTSSIDTSQVQEYGRERNWVLLLGKEDLRSVPGGRRSRTGTDVSFGVFDEVGLVPPTARSLSSSFDLMNHLQPRNEKYLLDFWRRLRTLLSAGGPLRFRAVAGTIPASVNEQGTFWNSHITHKSSWPSLNTHRCFRRLHASQGLPNRLGFRFADFGGDGTVVVDSGGEAIDGDTMRLQPCLY